MASPQELLTTIARLRRSQPRNPDTMLVCSELEARLVTKTPEGVRPKFDRTAYQRELMRRRRAEGKA